LTRGRVPSYDSPNDVARLPDTSRRRSEVRRDSVWNGGQSIHALKERTWDEQNKALTNAGLRQKRLLTIAVAVALLGAISQDIADKLQKNSDETLHGKQLKDAFEKGDAKVRQNLEDFN